MPTNNEIDKTEIKKKFVYDSDCGICVASVKFLSGKVKGVVFTSFSEYASGNQNSKISSEESKYGSYLIYENGDFAFGADAVIGVMAVGSLPLRVVAKFLKNPPFLKYSREVYFWIATNRRFLSAFPSACGMAEPSVEKLSNQSRFKPSLFFISLIVFLFWQFLTPAFLIILRVSHIFPTLWHVSYSFGWSMFT
jgi:predicted DCC family thiol-disulfide oxidoreductase YuxK